MGLLGDLAKGATEGATSGIGSIADLLKDGLDKVFPDPLEKAKAQALIDEAANAGKFKEMDQQFQLSLEQIKVNAIEARSPNWFVAGWRPAVGWVATTGLGFAFIPKAIVLCILWTIQAAVIIRGWDGKAALGLPPYPDMGVTDLIGILGTLLGVGTMRTVEKSRGVAGKH